MSFEQKAPKEISDGEEKQDIVSCGVFRYRSMDREKVNLNEHLQYTENNEKKFLKSLTVAFPIQYFKGDW